MKKTILSLIIALSCSNIITVTAQIVHDNVSSVSELKTIVAGITNDTHTIIKLAENSIFNVDEQISIGETTAAHVEIIGNNSIINDAASQHVRNLRLGYGKYRLEGITFRNANFTQIGGVIYFAGDELVVENCIFQNNVTTSVGGAAIASRGKDLIIRNSYFKENKLNGSGIGAVILHSGMGGRFVLENSTFEDNTYSGTETVAMIGFYDGSNLGPTDIRITNCNFLNNSTTSLLASSGSGVIGLFESMNAADVYIVNNTFLFNARSPEPDEPGLSNGDKGKAMYKRNVAVRLEKKTHKLHFVNNVVAGLRYPIAATQTVADGRIPVEAWNNYMVVMTQHQNVVADPAFTDNSYNNTVLISRTSGDDPIPDDIRDLDSNIATLKIGEQLEWDKVNPYIKVDKTSPLVNAGLTTYIVNSEECIPAHDIIGTDRNIAGNTIGAFQRDLELSVPEIGNQNEIASISQNSNYITITNNSDNELSVSVLRADGKQIYSSVVANTLEINKNGLGKGVLILIVKDASSSLVKKIVL
ncbi:MAG: T9SS type A sorting domain-containing protein [Candidatus Azobacteroides sp.]|nr:T9SS type A sorting domain-containing protein [Candidatus Azobacteroides sp.]